MCVVGIEYIDLDWLHGVTCHHFQHDRDSEGMMYEVKDFTAMTSPTVEKDVIIANNGSLCVQRQHAPPYQKPTSLS